MAAKILKFREPRIESHPVPNTVEEAKRMVDEHLKTDSFNILMLLDNRPAVQSNATCWQRLRRRWPLQNRWQILGVSIALGGHLIAWFLLYLQYGS